MAEPIGLILQQWADLGIFFYVLPFLLVFSLVYVILYKVNIMGSKANDNKGVYAIIAVTIALLSLQFDTVPIFFQIIFPKLGVGLAVILAVILLMGLFAPDATLRSGFGMLILSVGGITAIVILLQSFDEFSWWAGSWWQLHINGIIAGVIIIAVVAVFLNAGKERPVNQPPGIMQVWPSSGGK